MALDQLVIGLFKVLRHHSVHVLGLLLWLLFGLLCSSRVILAGLGRSSAFLRRGQFFRLLRIIIYRSGFLLLIGRWRIREQAVERLQQLEVTLGIKGGDNATVRTAVGGAHILRNVLAGGIIQGVRIFGLQQLLPALFNNLRIASNPQNASELLQIGFNFFDFWSDHDAMEGLKVAAQLAGSYTHLMHRVPLIAANTWIIINQLVAVSLQCGDHGGGRGIRVHVRRYQGRGKRGVGIRITQGRFQLGWGRRYACTGTDEKRGSTANELRSFLGTR